VTNVIAITKSAFNCTLACMEFELKFVLFESIDYAIKSAILVSREVLHDVFDDNFDLNLTFYRFNSYV
jgi:hypothetical protein